MIATRISTVVSRTATTSMLHHSMRPPGRPPSSRERTRESAALQVRWDNPRLAGWPATRHIPPRAPPPDVGSEVGMANDAGGRMKVVIYYAVWATLCAAAAGVAISFIHTWFFSYHGSRPGFWRTLLEDAAVTVGIAAGQGAVALVTGSVLTQLGRGLHEIGRASCRER